MKTKVKFTLLGILTLLIVSCVFGHYKNIRSDQLTKLTLQNIEALSQGETTTNVQCIGTGSLDCPISSSKVRSIFY